MLFAPTACTRNLEKHMSSLVPDNDYCQQRSSTLYSMFSVSVHEITSTRTFEHVKKKILNNLENAKNKTTTCTCLI